MVTHILQVASSKVWAMDFSVHKPGEYKKQDAVTRGGACLQDQCCSKPGALVQQ